MRVLPLALAAAIFSGLTAILIYLSGLSSYEGARVSETDLAALAVLQGGFSKCVDANGLGLQAAAGEDYCRVISCLQLLLLQRGDEDVNIVISVTPSSVSEKWFLNSCPVPIPLPFDKPQDIVVGHRLEYPPMQEC